MSEINTYNTLILSFLSDGGIFRRSNFLFNLLSFNQAKLEVDRTYLKIHFPYLQKFF